MCACVLALFLALLVVTRGRHQQISSSERSWYMHGWLYSPDPTTPSMDRFQYHAHDTSTGYDTSTGCDPRWGCMGLGPRLR